MRSFISKDLREAFADAKIIQFDYLREVFLVWHGMEYIIVYTLSGRQVDVFGGFHIIDHANRLDVATILVLSKMKEVIANNDYNILPENRDDWK